MKLEFAQNPAYVSFERHLRDLHGLIASGRGESEEADALRDAMASDHRLLSAEEENRLNGLSEDLYSLTESDDAAPPSSAPDPAAAVEFQRARQRHDWPSALLFLRRLGRGFPASDLAFQQFQAYAQLGHMETAFRFLERSADLDPTDFRKQHLFLEFSGKAGRGAEALARADQLLRDRATPTPLVIASAHLRFDTLRNSPDATALPVVRELAGTLERAMSAPEALADTPISVRIIGHTTLGFCLEKLGDLKGAMEAFDQALQLDPESDALRVARGLVLARHDMDRAAAEFTAAADVGSRLVHPYLFLAPYELGKGRWERARLFADKLLAYTQDPAVEAEALQWQAIAHFELGAPWRNVEALFRQAQVLDPLNPRIRDNMARCRQASTASEVRPSDISWSRPGPDDFPPAFRQFADLAA